jgi:hypothetical protein
MLNVVHVVGAGQNRGFVGCTASYIVSDEASDLKLIKSTELNLDDIIDYIRAPKNFSHIGYKSKVVGNIGQWGYRSSVTPSLVPF